MVYRVFSLRYVGDEPGYVVGIVIKAKPGLNLSSEVLIDKVVAEVAKHADVSIIDFARIYSREIGEKILLVVRAVSKAAVNELVSTLKTLPNVESVSIVEPDMFGMLVFEDAYPIIVDTPTGPEPSFIIPYKALKDMFKLMSDRLGDAGAIALAYHFGYMLGTALARSYEKTSNMAKALKILTNVMLGIGLSRAKVETGLFGTRLVLKDVVQELETYPFMRGFISGFLSEVTGTDIKIQPDDVKVEGDKVIVRVM